MAKVSIKIFYLIKCSKSLLNRCENNNLNFVSIFQNVSSGVTKNKRKNVFKPFVYDCLKPET